MSPVPFEDLEDGQVYYLIERNSDPIKVKISTRSDGKKFMRLGGRGNVRVKLLVHPEDNFLKE